jgi:mannose-1-phosphate guanylyltransferase
MSAFTETAHDETGSVDPDRGDAVRAKVRVAPVILAGGSGSRLWPMSREQYPKQLIGVLGADSLLQATVQRMTGFTAGESEVSAPIVVCGDEHRFVTAEQLRASGLAASIVVEPARRDTAPALTLAAAVAHADGQDAIVVAMPADHAIADTPAFHRAIALAVEHARRGAIATLGVPPTRPDTGFGYIKLGEALDGGAHRIERFVEKPAAELAAQYVESRAYWWNSGIFVVRASVWLDTLRALQPDMHAACLTAYVQGKTDGPFFRPHEQAFLQSPADSIDYAVMERLASTAVGAEGVVVPLDAGWSDLGSWDAVGGARQGRRRQRRSRQGRIRGRDVELRSFGRATRRMRRRDQCGGRRNGGRRAGGGSLACAGCERPREPHSRAAGAGGRRAPQGAAPVGLLRLDRSRRALPGQAHRRASRRPAVAPAPPSPRRTLDRREGLRSSRAATSNSCSARTSRPSFRWA